MEKELILKICFSDDIPMLANAIPEPISLIPGMGPDDKIEEDETTSGPETIPGLEYDSAVSSFDRLVIMN